MVAAGQADHVITHQAKDHQGRPRAASDDVA
jgi:hypothetical protein